MVAWLGLIAGGLAVGLLEIKRRRVVSARGRAARALAKSTGPRIFNAASIPPGDRQPLDRAVIREMAFHLVPADRPEEAPWIDGQRTVEETVERGGQLTLCYGTWQRDREVIFVEDVGESMARWPLHGRQLARSLAAQGRTVLHVYMRGEPQQIGTTRDFASGRPLAKLLEDHPRHARGGAIRRRRAGRA